MPVKNRSCIYRMAGKPRRKKEKSLPCSIETSKKHEVKVIDPGTQLGEMQSIHCFMVVRENLTIAHCIEKKLALSLFSDSRGILLSGQEEKKDETAQGERKGWLMTAWRLT